MSIIINDVTQVGGGTGGYFSLNRAKKPKITLSSS